MGPTPPGTGVKCVANFRVFFPLIQQPEKGLATDKDHKRRRRKRKKKEKEKEKKREGE